MNPFWVLVNDKLSASGLLTPRTRSGWTWNLGEAFSLYENAVEAAESWQKTHPDDHIDVVEAPNKQSINVNHVYAVKWCSHDSLTHTEGDTVDTEAQPLNIPRQSLIDRLQENLDAETAKRKEVEQREADAKAAFAAFVTEHQAEFIEYLGQNVGGPWESVLKLFTDKFEGGHYLPKETVPTTKENELEKYVRVLTMATDTTIEVKPTQSIYSLL